MAVGGRTSWAVPLAICCILLTLLLIFGTIILALIPVYLSTRDINANTNARQTRMIGSYASNLPNGRSLTLASTSPHGNQLVQKAGLQNSQVSAPSSSFTSNRPLNGKKRQTSTGNAICEQPVTLTGDTVLIQFDIIYPSICVSTDCQQRHLSNVEHALRLNYEVVTVDMTFTNGQTQTVQLQFCSFYFSISTDISTNPADSVTSSTSTGTATTSISTTPTDCIAETINYIYLITNDKILYRFNPTTLDLTQVGTLNCSSTTDSYYIALQRNGTLWALADDGILYNYNIQNAQCTQTTFVRNQSSISYFSMAFAKNDAGNGETLYISKQNGGGQVLGTINLSTLTVSIVGNYSDGVYADLSGTNDGRLYGLFSDTDFIIKGISKTNAQILSQFLVHEGANTDFYAFAPYNSKFFFFLTENNSTIIHSADPATNITTELKTVPQAFYNAATSTCLGTTGSGVTTTTAAVITNDCTTETRNSVYLINNDNILYRFAPTTRQLTQVGIINCSTTEYVYTIALQRNGLVWVLLTDGKLYTYDINTARCTETTFVRNQTDIQLFSMTFVKNNNNNGEALYISKQNGNGGVLGRIDLSTLSVTSVGNYSNGLRADLSGTNDGRLYGLFSDTSFIIKEINKANAQILSQYPLMQPISNDSLAFTYFSFNSRFFLFSGFRNHTEIFIFDPSTNTTTSQATVPQTTLFITAVSTCLNT